MSVNKSRNEIPTIDVNLVTIETDDGEFGFDTANQIEVEVQSEEEEAVRLVVKGRLRAQKPATSTITGHELMLHDNVFNPQLVKVLQGGTVLYWTDATKTDVTENETAFGVAKYTPPVAGSGEKGKPFKLNAYSAIYNAAGIITGYEKTTYPNCQGQPVAFNSEDGTFRAPEYTITSAPNTGEAPYEIFFVDELPDLVEPENLVTANIPTTGTFLNRTPAELGEYTIEDNTVIVGSAIRQVGFTDFSSDPTEQNGYFVVLNEIPSGVIGRVDRTTGKGKEVTITDGFLMVRLGGDRAEVDTLNYIVLIKDGTENRFGIRVKLVDN